MPSLLQNKYVRFGLFGLGTILLLIIFLSLLTSFSGSWSNGYMMNKNLGYSTAGMGGEMMNDAVVSEMAVAPSMGQAMRVEESLSSYYPGPTPTPIPPSSDGYTSGLEKFETTSYHLSARTSSFDQLCDTLIMLKESDSIHFKSLNHGLNNCNALFFVKEDEVSAVLDRFGGYKNVTIDRTTNSVTRHKENIENQASIIQTQLATVEATLAEAEVAYDEIIALARSTRDAEALNEAIRNKLQQIDNLTERKLWLTSQLDNFAQQEADLNERLGVVEFYASFTRSNPIQVGKYDRQWEQAWEQLTDQLTLTLIGVTALFGVFLLYMIQYGLYLLVLLVVARFGWKLLQRIWKM